MADTTPDEARKLAAEVSAEIAQCYDDTWAYTITRIVGRLVSAIRSLADQVEARDRRVAELEAALRGELSTAQSARLLAAKKETDRA